MKKVINVYYTNDIEELKASSATGLVLELEDGTFIRHQSTDVIMPFEVIDDPIHKDSVEGII